MSQAAAMLARSAPSGRWSSISRPSVPEPRLCCHKRPLPTHLAGYLLRTTLAAAIDPRKQRRTPLARASQPGLEQFPDDDEDYEYLEEEEEGEAELDYAGAAADASMRSALAAARGLRRAPGTPPA